MREEPPFIGHRRAELPVIHAMTVPKPISNCTGPMYEQVITYQIDSSNRATTIKNKSNYLIANQFDLFPTVYCSSFGHSPSFVEAAYPFTSQRKHG
jgi:hypothetical protein